MDKKELGFVCEHAVRFLVDNFPANDAKKPVLFHSIRVGTHLYEQGYSRDVVIAGFLHDVLEDVPSMTEEIIAGKFGAVVAQIVSANSKDESITDKVKRKRDMIVRCIAAGKAATIVKAADILDNYSYYKMTDNTDELQHHCVPMAQELIAHLPDDYTDPIFERIYQIN